MRFSGLATTQTAGLNDPFSIDVGIPNADGSNLAAAQAVRAGAPPLNFTVTSSNAAAGIFVFGATSGDSITIPIQPGTAQTSATFRPLAAGTTQAVVSAPGVLTTGAGRVNMTVN